MHDICRKKEEDVNLMHTEKEAVEMNLILKSSLVGSQNSAGLGGFVQDN